MSASHPYFRILTVPGPSPLTFCTTQTGKSRCHLPLSLTLCTPFPSFFFFSLSHLFPVSLTFSLSVCGLDVGGGGSLSYSEMNFWLLLGRTERFHWSEEAREERQRLEEKRKRHFFSLAAYDHNCTPPFFSSDCFPLSAEQQQAIIWTTGANYAN